MILPLWAIYAFAAALLIATIPLVQEKFKAEGYALALWVKVFMVFLLLPFIMRYGLPADYHFYLYVGLTCILYCVSDVIYYRAIPQIGSGMMTRLLPSSVVVTFVLWFIVDPALAASYLAQPWKAVAIGVTLALFLFCAAQVKKCALSWESLRKIWYIIFAASIGPIWTKLSFNYASAEQATYAYIFFQSLVMVVLFLGFFIVKKPAPRAALVSKNAILTGLILSVIGFVSGFLKLKAIQLVDNPAFVAMILFTDSLWVLLVYKFIGRREKANIIAGFGIVISAVLIVLIKNWH